MKTLKGNKVSNHCTVSSKVQAIFLFAHVYVGFLKNGPVLWDSMKDFWVNVFLTRQTLQGFEVS